MTGKGSKLSGRAWILPIWFCLMLSSPALAEVSDKEPDAIQVWLVAAGICAVAFVAAKIRPWFALPLLPVSSLLALAHISELNDPAVGPAIRQELGEAYIWQVYLAAAVALIGPLTAWATLRMLRNRRKL